MKTTKAPLCFEVVFVRHHLAMPAGGTLKRTDIRLCTSNQVLTLSLSVLKFFWHNSHGIQANDLHFWWYCCVLITSWRCLTAASSCTYYHGIWNLSIPFFQLFKINISPSKDIFAKVWTKRIGNMSYKFNIHKIFTPFTPKSEHSSCGLKHQ